MKTSDNSLIEEIRASVDGLAKRGGIDSERAFAAWYGINVFDLDEDEALQAAALDGSEDQGIDFLHTDHQRERIIVLQAHYPKNINKATPKNKWDALVSAFPSLTTPESFSAAGRPELAAAAEEALENIEEYELCFTLASLGAHSDQIARSVAAHKKKPQHKNINYDYANNSKIQSYFRSVKSGNSAIPLDTIKFDNDKYFSINGEFGSAWVGSVSAAELRRLYQSHGDRLFARNIRLFLGKRKGGINEQIIETAKTSPGTFWALNNGITIVADTVKHDNNAAFQITQFSIVNGCQTTVSLASTDTPGASVLTRIVMAKPSVVNDIVRFNNTQNAIKIWTVRAVDKTQERLRKAFAAIDINYAPKPAQGTRRRSRSAITIELDKVAQYIAARESGTLIAAVKEKSELFDKHYAEIFPHSIITEDVYLAWKLGTLADAIRQERFEDIGTDDRTLHALCGIIGTYWTIFCTSKLITAINPTLRLGLAAMNTEQFENALRKYVNKGLDEYLEIAIALVDSEEHRSVRSALRSPKFLDKFQKMLTVRTASLKRKGALPPLDAVLRSTPRKNVTKAKKAS